MKGTELIKLVQEIIDEHGDLDVGIENAELMYFYSVKTVWFKKAKTDGDICEQDEVSDAAYFIAID